VSVRRTAYSSLGTGLSEALNLPELAAACESLRATVEASLRGSAGQSGPRSRAELINGNRRLEEENRAVRAQLQELESRSNEALTHLKEEVFKSPHSSVASLTLSV
jgi:hypothetical protein